MKFNIGLLAAALQITGVLSVAAPEADLVAECGDLGVMTVPEGADPSTVRKCADHPLGNNPRKYEQSLPPADAEFQKRDATPAQLKGADIFGRAEQACYYDAGFGCSGNYCWKACGSPGDGKWCWTAAGDGSGDWLSCATFNDCNTDAACGQGFGCTRCGCGC